MAKRHSRNGKREDRKRWVDAIAWFSVMAHGRLRDDRTATSQARQALRQRGIGVRFHRYGREGGGR